MSEEARELKKMVGGGDEHPFDRAIRVERVDDHWRAHTSPNYWAFVGPFGGATSATVLNAIMADARRNGEPVALTIQFCAAIAEGAYEIRPRVARENRSSQFWTADVAQGEGVVSTAQIVLAQRKPSFSKQPTEPPRLPDAQSLSPFVVGGPTDWTWNYEFRFAAGKPSLGDCVKGDGETSSTLWLRDTPERIIDLFSLAATSDAFFGRIFNAVGAIVPFGTVSMSTYFHATEAELRESSIKQIIGRVRCNRLHAGYQDQVGELWSPDGVLLATSHQLAYFRHPPITD